MDLGARATLPLVMTTTEKSFQALLQRENINRSAYAVYLPRHDAVVLSPRADRATLAHEFAHSLGARHIADQPNIAREIERDVRRGEICSRG